VAVVISLGGSVVSSGPAEENYKNQGMIEKYSTLLRELSAKEKLGIVVGGGKLARDRIAKARSEGKSEVWCDWEAIEATKYNAKLLITALGGDTNPEPINDFIKAAEHLKQHNIVVMFGTIPGITTDTDAVLLGEHIGAQRFVNITNVDGVWDENKETIEQMDHERLVTMAMAADKRRAGEHFIIDALAAKLLARSNIEARFVNGTNIDNVRKAILGEPHKGTIVRD
jgi:uridylate kinase